MAVLSAQIPDQITAIAESCEIFGIKTCAQTLDGAIATMHLWTQSAAKRYVSTCCVYTLMKAQEDPQVAAALASADMVTADGMPLVWLQHRDGFRMAERVYGPDILRAFLARTADCGLHHVLLGGNKHSAKRLAEILQRDFPCSTVTVFDWPYTEDLTGDALDAAAIQELNRLNAHVVWVGLGSPKQDLWMARYRPYLQSPVLIGIGAAFDFVSGTKRQCPRWLQRRGGEWLFRLIQEPRRLWRRYLRNNPLFLWYLFCERTGLKSF